MPSRNVCLSDLLGGDFDPNQRKNISYLTKQFTNTILQLTISQKVLVNRSELDNEVKLIVRDFRRKLSNSKYSKKNAAKRDTPSPCTE